MIWAEQRWLMVENIAHSLNGDRRSIDQPRDAGQASQRFKRQSQGAEERHELPNGFGAADDFISTVNDDAGKADATHHIHQRGDNGGAKQSFDLNFDLPFGERTIAVGVVTLQTIELDRSYPVEGFVEARRHVAGDFSCFNGLFARVALCHQRGKQQQRCTDQCCKGPKPIDGEHDRKKRYQSDEITGRAAHQKRPYSRHRLHIAVDPLHQISRCIAGEKAEI